MKNLIFWTGLVLLWATLSVALAFIIRTLDDDED